MMRTILTRRCRFIEPIVVAGFKTLVKILLFLLLFRVGPALAAEPLLIDDFETDLSRWEVQSFQGLTEYRLVSQGNGHVLAAHSRNSASGLIRKIRIDPAKYPILSWRWKVAGVLRKGDASSKRTDDYAARLYVVFPYWFRPLSRALNYIWANRLPKGAAVPNAYSSRAMMIAVESGSAKAGMWLTEQRDLVADYRKCFGGDPPMIGAIAIMTDTDNTGEEARAWYDDILLLPKK